MKVISHSQEGFLALYVIALREVGHERESSRSSADRAKACQIIQLLLCGNFVNLQCSSFLSPSLSLSLTFRAHFSVKPVTFLLYFLSGNMVINRIKVTSSATQL